LPRLLVNSREEEKKGKGEREGRGEEEELAVGAWGTEVST
jgi:hypothetical protein